MLHMSHLNLIKLQMLAHDNSILIIHQCSSFYKQKALNPFPYWNFDFYILSIGVKKSLECELQISQIWEIDGCICHLTSQSRILVQSTQNIVQRENKQVQRNKPTEL